MALGPAGRAVETLRHSATAPGHDSAWATRGVIVLTVSLFGETLKPPRIPGYLALKHKAEHRRGLNPL